LLMSVLAALRIDSNTDAIVCRYSELTPVCAAGTALQKAILRDIAAKDVSLAGDYSPQTVLLLQCSKGA